MSSEDEGSGIRGRIDRFFDKRAKEQQDLISNALGGEAVEQKDTKKAKLAQTKKSEKIHKVKKSKKPMPSSGKEVPDVEISPIARSFVRITTDYPPITIGIMTAIMLFMLVGIGKTNINGAMEVYLPKGSVEEELLLEVREDWSTDIIVIYVETENVYDISNKANILVDKFCLKWIILSARLIHKDKQKREVQE